MTRRSTCLSLQESFFGDDEVNTTIMGFVRECHLKLAFKAHSDGHGVLILGEQPVVVPTAMTQSPTLAVECNSWH